MRHGTWTLLVLLALQGCTYQQAMHRGDEAALAQNWDVAYDAYRFANEVKPGKADAAVAKARTAAAEAEVVAAETALVAKDFATAADHLDRAAERDPELPRIAAVRTAAHDAMVTELARRTAAHEPVRATYEFSVLATRLYPTSPQFEDATEALRDQVEADALALLDDGKYADARVMARTIAEVEPEEATRGTALDHEVTNAWVARLAQKAEAAAKTDRPALAAVYYARAYEVGGLEDYKLASQHSLALAAPSAELAVYVDSQGSGARHWRLRKALKTAALASPGVRSGVSSNWDLGPTIYANAERCAETKKIVPMTQDYVSGTRQVPNPAYAAVTDDLEQAEAALGIEVAELQKAQGDAEASRTALAGVEAARADAQAAYDAAQATLTDSQTQRDAAQDKLAELVKAGAGGVDEATNQRQTLTDWNNKVALDGKAITAAKFALDAAAAKVDPVKAESERRAGVATEAQTEKDAAEKAAAELRQKKRDTPATLTEDVHQTAKYAETTWTISCTAPATVYFGTRWHTDLPKKQTFVAKSSTSDVSRPAHEGAKITADPKQYPRTERELIAELDATSEQSIATALEAFVAESFDKKIEAALSATGNVGAATDTLMTVLAGAPERLDAADRTRLIEHLKTNYGIEDPGLLGLAEAPAAAPPAPVDPGVSATPTP
jgi:hypothetical protein